MDIIKTTNRYGATNAAPYPLAISHGKGIYLYDIQGNSYIDMASGISATNFGHQHPRLMKALTDQAKKLSVLPRLFYNKPLSELLKTSCQLFNMDKALPMNSGAEATETAIKIARKWAYTVKKIPDNCAEIISCENNFHGRTITTISMSSVNQYKANFGPLTPGFVSVPFNDTHALKNAINKNTAAFIVEPIQGEAGVIIPDSDYLEKCAAICQKNNVLFIIDEIQTGLGRTGKLLASQHEDVKADGILLGKSLGGGILPISLFLAKESLMNVIKPGEHGSTFGGNPLASHIAFETLKLLQEENLAEKAAKLGQYFRYRLNKINHPAIHDIRGKGLFIVIAIDKRITSSQIVFEKLTQHGLVSISTRNNCIRLLPPLIINKEQLDDAIDIIQHVFHHHL